ncbi:MAG TPA: nicotinate-nucleotide adenylyltransferase, partial [Dissulfurispiraceae bacterium]
MRLGIFGGTFNPIHFGHLRTAEEVRYKLNLDKVVFIPSGNPPLKSLDLTDASHRYAMARLAAESNRYFDVSDIELKQPDKSFTVNTLQKLCELYPRDELYFVLGLDAFLDMPNWWQPERLIRMVEFVVVPRPGSDTEDIAKSPYIEDSGKLRVTSNELKDKKDSLLTLELKGGRSATLV